MSGRWVPIRQAVDELGIRKATILGYKKHGRIETRLVTNPDNSRFGDRPTLTAVNLDEVRAVYESNINAKAQRAADVAHDIHHFMRWCGMDLDEAIRRAADGYGITEPTARRFYTQAQDMAVAA